ncbi:MAG: 30S ribosomal protein S6 [Patescibacteria group bacterium]
MKTYQLNYLLSPELYNEALKETCETIQRMLADAGAILENSETPSKKDLGVSIAGQKSAFLGAINFSMSAEKLADFRPQMTAFKPVLRYMLTIKTAVRTQKKAPRTLDKTKWTPKKEIKVEMMDIEKKLGEILGE